jgi:serine/threonine protein kinase
MGCIVYPTNKQGIISNNPEELKKRVIQPTNSDIRKNYEFISMLGHGAFGKVRLYRDRNYKDLLFAIKTLKKEGIPEYQFNLLKSEVSILSNLDHPNIVKYFGTFEDDYYIHILMEYLKGHDLNEIINLKNIQVSKKKTCPK